jgi:hypothetical protein
VPTLRDDRTMLLNLSEQLDAVLDYLSPFWEMERTLVRRFSRASLPPRRFIQMYGLAYRNRRDLGRDPARLRLSGGEQDIFALLASDEERSSEQFAPLANAFPLHCIAEKLVARFPDVNFKHLQKLFEVRRKTIELGAKQVFGIGLAAGSLVLKTVPKPVVEKVWHVDYDQFQIVMFWVIVGLTVYLGLVLGPIWLPRVKHRRKHHYIQEILDYVVIATEG